MKNIPSLISSFELFTYPTRPTGLYLNSYYKEGIQLTVSSEEKAPCHLWDPHGFYNCINLNPLDPYPTILPNEDDGPNAYLWPSLTILDSCACNSAYAWLPTNPVYSSYAPVRSLVDMVIIHRSIFSPHYILSHFLFFSSSMSITLPDSALSEYWIKINNKYKYKIIIIY
jgi:hypothetical protein